MRENSKLLDFFITFTFMCKKTLQEAQNCQEKKLYFFLWKDANIKKNT